MSRHTECAYYNEACHGKKSKSARVFARRWSLRGITRFAFVVATMGDRGRSGRCESRGCAGLSTVADGLRYDSERRESRSMVAEGRRQAVSARHDDGAACGAEGSD